MDSFASQTAANALATGWPEVATACTGIAPIAGGLSDSVLFRIETPHGLFRLQLPPKGLSRHAAAATPSLLAAAHRAAIPIVPTIIEPRRPVLGWSLLTWLPGQVIAAVDWRNEHTKSAAEALANLHRAQAAGANGLSPSIQKRFKHLAARPIYRPTQFDRIADRLESAWKPPGVAEFEQLFELAKKAIGRIVDQKVPQHHCWGDAWRGNILFAGDQLSGFIDFDTACVDTPMLDLARFAGSLPDSQQRQLALDCYAETRGLSEQEQAIASALDISGVVISLANWARWSEERHPSVDRPAALERITHLASRLRQLAAGGDGEFL